MHLLLLVFFEGLILFAIYYTLAWPDRFFSFDMGRRKPPYQKKKGVSVTMRDYHMTHFLITCMHENKSL